MDDGCPFGRRDPVFEPLWQKQHGHTGPPVSGGFGTHLAAPEDPNGLIQWRNFARPAQAADRRPLRQAAPTGHWPCVRLSAVKPISTLMFDAGLSGRIGIRETGTSFIGPLPRVLCLAPSRADFVLPEPRRWASSALPPGPAFAADIV
jgi:hypothetical protein